MNQKHNKVLKSTLDIEGNKMNFRTQEMRGVLGYKKIITIIVLIIVSYDNIVLPLSFQKKDQLCNYIVYQLD